jgi:diguanylate cyclase (GGDEF)-like protein/PAS domain S-box-containing protein
VTAQSDRALQTLRALLSSVPEVTDRGRLALDPYIEAHAAVIDALQDLSAILAISDCDNRLVRLNHAACVFLGRAECDMLGHSVVEYLTPECRDQMAAAMAADAAGNAATYGNDEWAFVRPDGSVVWAAVRTMRLRDVNGLTWSRISVVEDITAGRAAAAEEALLRTGLQRYRTVFERGAVPQIVLDFSSFRIILANAAFCALSGFGIDEVVGSDARLIYTDDPSADAVQRLSVGDHMSYAATRELRLSNGSTLPVLSTVAAVRNDAGVVVQLLVMMHDMTDELATADQERRSQALLKAALEALPVTFTTFDTDLRFTSVEGGLNEPGTTPQMCLGKPVTEVTKDPPTLRALHEALAGGESSTRTVVNGSTYHTLYGPICSDAGEVVGVVAVATNVSADVAREANLRAAEEKRLFLAEHDSLTGLPGRAALMEHLNTLNATGDGEGTLMLVDLDDFEMINEGLGHAVGDGVLLEVASRLAEAFPGRMVARHGADEFAVVAPYAVGRAEAQDASERVSRALDADVEVGEHTFRVTASIGLAVGKIHGQSSLMSNADAALSRAKAAGTAQYRSYDDEMRRHVQRCLRIQSGLRTALSTGQLHVAYQPIVTLADRRIIGAEALLRWTHPQWGVVTPAEFIPVAERSGLISPIGRWVMNAACTDALTLQRDRGMYVTVNVSVGQLVDGNFAAWVEDVLDRTGLPACALTVEVTESAVMDDIVRTRAAFDRLRGRGIKISIDDFGTGYSSLARLQHLPVDVIKLDRAFVTQLDVRREARGMAAAILQLSTAIGANIVAEGVETEAEAATLIDLGYTVGQGFLFARPISIEDLTRRLQAQPVVSVVAHRRRRVRVAGVAGAA